MYSNAIFIPVVDLPFVYFSPSAALNADARNSCGPLATAAVVTSPAAFTVFDDHRALYAALERVLRILRIHRVDLPPLEFDPPGLAHLGRSAGQWASRNDDGLRAGDGVISPFGVSSLSSNDSTGFVASIVALIVTDVPSSKLAS